VDRSFGDVNGNVDTVIADGLGGWFVGGAFTSVGNVIRSDIAHLHADGSLDRSWRGALGRDDIPPVEALALRGDKLFVGDAAGVVALDARTGARLWRAGVRHSPTEALGVLALAAGGGRVYVAGNFDRVAGTPRHTLAALDEANGHLLSWRGPTLRNGSDPPALSYVDALALIGKRLYIGGVFDHQLLALRTSDGIQVWAPRADVGDVDTIVVDDGIVFTAGLDGSAATNIRTREPITWLHAVWVRLAASGRLVYFGGDLRTHMNARGNLAALDLTTHRFTRWSPYLARFAGVKAIAATASQVLVAGSFSKCIG
jgi:outer membrane protein assembly factor BamB